MEETLTIDDINVCYDLAGSGEPLLLIHGLNVGKSVWKEFLAQAAKHYTVYAVDLPGFGYSDAPNVPYGIPFYVDFLFKFLDSLNVNKVNIVGSSMGGEIAAMMAAKHPERVSNLVLLAPGGLTPLHTRFANTGWLMDASFWLMSRNKNLYLKSFEEKFSNPDKIPDWLVDESWEMLKSSDYRRAFHRNAQYLARLDPQFSEGLRLVKARTLIIWGAQDQVVPVSDAEKFEELIPGALVKILDNCGHLALIECGEQCNNMILSFLGEEDLYYSSDEM